MIEIPDWLWQELAANAIYDLISVSAAAGGGIAVRWALKNRQWIADTLGPNKRTVHLSGEVKGVGALSGTLRVVSERQAIWNTHARVVSERPIIWNVEARNRFIDRILETVSWVLPDLVRHILR